MTYARTLATGQGKLAYRLQVEGLRKEIVTDATMARSLSDGRSRVVGLVRKGLVEKETPDLARATIKGGQIVVRMEDIGGELTDLFKLAPTKRTWLTANLTATGTAMTVASNAGFVAGDFIHVGGECMKVDSVAGSTTINLVNSAGVRTAQWSTVARAHYAAYGASGGQALAYPGVTNAPITTLGRRARLFAYGEGDDPQGDGTQIWLGRCTSGPRLESAATWSISLDSIASLLEQDLGADLEDPVIPRGIYYPWCAPLRIYLELSSTSSVTGSTASSATIDVFGFYESQEAFVAALNATIASATAGWSTAVRAQVTQGGWQLVMVTASASQRAVRVYTNSPPTDLRIDTSFFVNGSGVASDSVAANETLYTRFYAPVPRGVYGVPRTLPSGADATKAATYPEDRIYLGGALAPDSLTSAVVVDWPELGGVTHRLPATDGYSTSARWVRLRNLPDPREAPPARIFVPYGGDGVPTLKFGRYYAGGDLHALLSALTSLTATYVSVGSVPDLRSDDFELSEIDAVVAEATAGIGYLANRDYSAFSPKKLTEALAAEAQILGCIWCLSSSGKLTLRRLAVPSLGMVTATIDASNVLVDSSFPTSDSDAFGSVNIVRLRTGYDPLEDEHRGPALVQRYVPGFSASNAPRVVEISPVFAPADTRLQDAIQVALRASGALFAILGNPYDLVRVEVPFSLRSVRCGDVVSLTNAQLPNSDGGRGVSDRPCLVVGREFNLATGRGVLTLLCGTGRAKGYAPAMRVESASVVSGNTWDLTLTAAPPASGSVDYVPAHAPNASDWFEVGDRVRVWQWDSASPTVRQGAVDSVSGLLMRVTFTSAWGGLGGNTYICGFDVASTSGLQAGQREYDFMAGTDLLVDFTTAQPATEMGP